MPKTILEQINNENAAKVFNAAMEDLLAVRSEKRPFTELIRTLASAAATVKGVIQTESAMEALKFARTKYEKEIKMLEMEKKK